MFKWLGRALDSPKSRAASRLCGVTGWLGVITLQFTSFFMQLPLPESYEMFLITCAALTGVEILEGIVAAFKGTSTSREYGEELFESSETTRAAGGAPTYEDLTGRPL